MYTGDWVTVSRDVLSSYQTFKNLGFDNQRILNSLEDKYHLPQREIRELLRKRGVNI